MRNPAEKLHVLQRKVCLNILTNPLINNKKFVVMRATTFFFWKVRLSLTLFFDNVQGDSDYGQFALLLCLQVHLEQIEGVGAARRPRRRQTPKIPPGQFVPWIPAATRRRTHHYTSNI